jgi:putative membrane protein
MLRRWLTPRSVRLENARSAARTAFVDGRYSRLPQRNAVLVYVALLERHVEVVADLGIRVEALEPGWSATTEALAGALRAQPDLERFLAALRRLGALLGREHPRLPDDVNELPDEVSA